MKARVYVTLKSGVLDPQGQAVAGTLGRLGYGEVESVRIGKYVELTLRDGDREATRARLEEMCRRLIANTVIEDYRIEMAEAGLGHSEGLGPQASGLGRSKNKPAAASKAKVRKAAAKKPAKKAAPKKPARRK